MSRFYKINRKILLNSIRMSVVVIIVLSLASCETNELSELTAVDEPNDDLELVTYQNTTKSILDNACVDCHNTVTANGGIMLNSYEAARAVAESGRMLTRMTSTSNPMPPTGNLPASLVEDIMKWIDDGLLEN